MLIGVLKEARPGETRVAATPETVGKLRGLGYDVTVEPGAGLASGFFDEAYVEAGASVGSVAEADIVFGVNAPSSSQLDAVKSGATVVSLLAPALKPELVEDLAKRPITALAMDAVPRISRAQSLDVLSSMANIAGYRAVVEAAHTFGRFFTGQVTAAGKVNPAKVLVVGAGVAGLAAIGAAGSLGAIVRATDPRPEVADQVKSLGGEYLSIEDPNAEVSATGYAKEMGDDYKAREKELYAAQCREVDIIVTTALIPGRPAPRIITGEMVASMKPGSVIVDMAAANGGNVEGSVAGESVVTGNGVTILGYTDLAGRLPAQASQLYGTNLVNLMKLMTPEKDGRLVVDFDDVVVRSITVVRNGELTWPPPPVQVSAVPQKPAAPVKEEEPAKEPMSSGRRLGIVLGIAAVFLLLAALAPAALLPHLTVFALAIVIGYYVIGHVHHALHTPLMSVTNAISGIIVVGALLNLVSGNTVVVVLAAVATLLATINIFGGFAVTRRMLAMFSRS
ncbi:NAD(P)(+) transhydrogenase (Re/Si-specific) subunit alpha [Amycolatopsis sp. AA4]|uniref:Re/Si-specific NAD(P)(+) transhydrogenase subunit alpha n=1 Tax=Actinomycetes TaxID=1760 RepID=UPI0001B55B4D|nr:MULTISPECIES: Re/Si-specific NAD(P)(+) transhydrogenase subunit alpha [Actinomycetes]ATY13134.1 NAD(P)(+) transhydrogenase (Re/Si-specific) subunit alpha [Amycolatopsis sp. AA4]EFL09031.1 NAD(P)(+) transhydrogenase alpha subunit [Streptomyces sp. AA4]